MNPERHADVEVDAAATRWAARRRAGLAETERRELIAWLAADGRHRAALQRADPGRDEMDWPLYSGKTDAILIGLERRTQKRRARQWAFSAGAAAMLAFGLVAWRLVPHRQPAAEPTLTVVPPHRQVLADGTVVELRAGAEIFTDFNDARFRLVTLVRGTAHFEVAPNPERPFVVKAGEMAVRAVGTAFAIELKSDEVNVVVTHGRVAVDHAPPATGTALDLVTAGNLIVMERVSSGAPSPAPVLPVVRPAATAELEATLGWRIPRLEFSGTLLPEVVKAMNRYNRVQFTIADASLGVLRVSGALRADKAEVLVEILEADFPVKAERRGPDEIVLRRAR